jgi:hypothetical protein
MKWLLHPLWVFLYRYSLQQSREAWLDGDLVACKQWAERGLRAGELAGIWKEKP